jgi:hypothetical protein
MIRILMILLFTGCASVPVCDESSNTIEEKENCRAQQETYQRNQEHMWRHDRFNIR